MCECGYACVCVCMCVCGAWVALGSFHIGCGCGSACSALLCRCACPAPEQLRIIFVLASLPWNSQPLYDDACCSPAQHCTAQHSESAPGSPRLSVHTENPELWRVQSKSRFISTSSIQSSLFPFVFSSYPLLLCASDCASACASIPLSLSLDASALSSLMLARALLSCPSLGFHL